VYKILRKFILISICLLLVASFRMESDTLFQCSEKFCDFVLATPAEIYALRDRVDAILEPLNSDYYKIGLSVISLDSPFIFYELNVDESFIPASNLKLITSAAGLYKLSPCFRWETRFFINHDNDLYVEATGDPTWSNRFRRGSIDRIMGSIADSLKAHDIHEINNIIVRTGGFHDYQFGAGWRESNRHYTFSALSSVLAFNNNTVQLQISPQAVGTPARIRLYPLNRGITIINQTRTVTARNQHSIRINTNPANNEITLSGNVWNRHRTVYRSIAIPRPELYALEVFNSKLNQSGVAVTGESFFLNLNEEDLFMKRFRDLFTIYSTPLIYIVNSINRTSNNFFANQLLLTIGESNGLAFDAEQYIKEWMWSKGVNSDSLRMFDGSGLSQYNRATPRMLTDILRVMHDSPWAEEFHNSLAISGTAGTLRNSFDCDVLRGQVQAKTGFILGVRGLSGVIQTADGERLAFSFLINRYDSRLRHFNRFAEQIMLELASFTFFETTYIAEVESKQF
jgi:D-alanyl-D-alanine carboxypeptidase/D-alanyl-D-alanine-endopeptidase (penicillin-binding protein 4)